MLFLNYSQFAFDLYMKIANGAIPIALVFGICNLIVSWFFNAWFKGRLSGRD